VQTDAPVMLMKVPATQATQVDKPVDEEKEPAAHEAHDDCPGCI